MCGRFSFFSWITTPEKVKKRFGIDVSENIELKPSYNICPFKTTPVIYSDENNQRQIIPMFWQLIPAFSKEFNSKYSMFNTRVESFEKKGFWPGLLKNSRCLIPANNFIEWVKSEGGKKPFKFELKNNSLMTFGGIYSIWRDKDNEAHYSFSIITTPANHLVKKIHPRMPFILSRENENIWLDKKNKPLEQIKSMIGPYPESEMQSIIVSQEINNTKNDYPELLKPSG